MPRTYGINCCNCVILSGDLEMCSCDCHYDKIDIGVQRRKIAKWRDSEWIRKNRTPAQQISLEVKN